MSLSRNIKCFVNVGTTARPILTRDAMEMQAKAEAEAKSCKQSGFTFPHYRWICGLALTILLAHGALLAASIPDYRVTIDSAFHVSMGRYYGEHGQAWWDHINFGPEGRPNLQGPLLHASIGALGRTLGGNGNDYVLANAILAVAQWAAAMATAAFFSYLEGGAYAMLFTSSLLSGAAFASGSFAAGIPSGWLFIFTPWAIWFFLRERLVASTAATSAGIYVHLGGYFTTPIGVLVAAILTRRWRALLLVGLMTVVVTAPFTFHVLRYLGWMSGLQSHPALLFDPMLDVLAIAGAATILRNPRRNPFMTAWLLAPIAWVFQDPSRFVLQWVLGGSVAAGCMVAGFIPRISIRWRRTIFTGLLVGFATFLPSGPPSIASEISWCRGMRYPRAVDWNQAASLAAVIRRAGLERELIDDYNPALCPAIAVFAPIQCEKGHWVEVEPRKDPADYIAAWEKAYVLPVPQNDPILRELASRGWVQVRGGFDDSAVITISADPPADSVASISARIIWRESAWLSRNAINNSITLADWRLTSSQRAMSHFRIMLAIQRVHAGRIEMALLIYASALESGYPDDAFAMRRFARAAGVIASFISDDLGMDYLGGQRFANIRRQWTKLSTTSSADLYPHAGTHFIQTFEGLVDAGLDTRGTTFAERPSGDRFPWMP